MDVVWADHNQSSSKMSPRTRSTTKRDRIQHVVTPNKNHSVPDRGVKAGKTVSKTQSPVSKKNLLTRASIPAVENLSIKPSPAKKKCRPKKKGTPLGAKIVDYHVMVQWEYLDDGTKFWREGRITEYREEKTKPYCHHVAYTWGSPSDYWHTHSFKDDFVGFRFIEDPLTSQKEKSKDDNEDQQNGK